MKFNDPKNRIDLDGVGLRLRAVRISTGLNAQDFAGSVDIDKSSYSKIEQGKKALNADMAYRVAQTWAVSMDFLYRGRLTDLPANILDSLRQIQNGSET